MSKFWTYKGKPVKELPEWCAGFVYEITNTHNGKKYIGKKLAKFKRSRRPLKGRVNKRRTQYQATGKIILDRVMRCLKMLIKLEKKNSKGKFYFTVKIEASVIILKQENSLLVKY